MESAKKSAVIYAAGLTKVFRDFWNRPKAKAVNDIDFQIHEGEVVGLLGPNGSGKSTTVKMILGLLYPSAGQLSVFGKAPSDVKTKKDIGYLPEETYLYKYLNAIETLDFFGSLFNLSAAERKRRAEQLLDMVGLSHAKHRQVGEFSKGMARRIGLAQAMINDPSLLILDEPTSGLDPLGCREVKDLIIMLKKTREDCAGHKPSAQRCGGCLRQSHNTLRRQDQGLRHADRASDSARGDPYQNPGHEAGNH